MRKTTNYISRYIAIKRQFLVSIIDQFYSQFSFLSNEWPMLNIYVDVENTHSTRRYVSKYNGHRFKSAQLDFKRDQVQLGVFQWKQ